MFTSLVLIKVGLILINLYFSFSLVNAVRRPNLFLWLLLAPVAVILAIALTWPPAMQLFRFGPLHVDDLAVSVGAAFGVLLIILATWGPSRWR